MFCPHCGKENEDGADFCAFCGKPIEKENAFGNGKEKIENVLKKQLNIRKSTVKKMLLAFVILIVIGSIGAISTNVKNSRVELEDYLSDELICLGINGYGSVDEFSFIDYERLNRALRNDEYSNEQALWDIAEAYVQHYMSIEFENDGNLSNGDKVKVTITFDSEGIKNSKYFSKIIAGKEKRTFTYEISGLNECIVIDILDAIENVIYDTTASYSKQNIALKDNYSKEYSNGIKVVTEDDEIRVYGNDFYSFSVDVELRTDNIHSNTETVDVFLEDEADSYTDYGIGLAPISKTVDVNVVSVAIDNSFTEDDLQTLSSGITEMITENFDAQNYVLDKVIFYYFDESNDNMLVYSYKETIKNEEAEEVVYHIFYYEYIKLNDDGSVFEINSLEPDYRSSEYDTFEDYEQTITYSAKYEIQ